MRVCSFQQELATSMIRGELMPGGIIAQKIAFSHADIG